MGTVMNKRHQLDLLGWFRRGNWWETTVRRASRPIGPTLSNTSGRYDEGLHQDLCTTGCGLIACGRPWNSGSADHEAAFARLRVRSCSSSSLKNAGDHSSGISGQFSKGVLR